MDVGSTSHMHYNFILKDYLAEKLMQDGHVTTPNLCFIHVFLPLYCLSLLFHTYTYYLYNVYRFKLSIVCFYTFSKSTSIFVVPDY